MFDRTKSPEARRKLGHDHLRLSTTDRNDAVRRLEAHQSLGRLPEDEAGRRIKAAERSETPEEIARLFVDLPPLPIRAPSIEQRISAQDRQDAILLLEKAYSEGRLETHECAVAKDQVGLARTSSEIDAAFHGLSTPAQAARGEKASRVTKQTTEVGARVLAEGGRRARKAFRRGVLAVGALLVGVILVIAGIGAAALICFVVAVLLLVSAAISLVRWTS